MSNNTRIWLHGLAAAFVGAIGNSIGTIAVAPDRFNLTSLSGVRNVALSSVISGVAAVGLYLSKSPVPSTTLTVDATHQTLTQGNTTLTKDTTCTTIATPTDSK